VGRSATGSIQGPPQTDRFLDFIDQVNGGLRLEATAPGIYTAGKATVRSADRPAEPRSLHELQVAARRGDDAAVRTLARLEERLGIGVRDDKDVP
jgi:hypothetical protein